MASIPNSELTAKGHALIHKVHTGRARFHFSGFQAGDGQLKGSIEELTELVNRRIDGKIVHVLEMGTFTQFVCVITNQHLTEGMVLREVGIWADDPDEGSILYAYADLSQHPSTIGEFSGRWLHEETMPWWSLLA